MKGRATYRVWLADTLFVICGSVISLFILSWRANTTDSALTDASFTAHLAQLEKKVPKGFTVLVQPPFVVIGDEPPEMVRRRATNTVKWAVDKPRPPCAPNATGRIDKVTLHSIPLRTFVATATIAHFAKCA